jgi:hypothetical protein
MAKWLYSHEGRVQGPFSVSEMKALAAQGIVVPEDKIWQEGSDPKTAVRAGTALPFSARPKKAGPAFDPVLFGTSQALPATAPAAPPMVVDVVQVAMVANVLPEAVPVDVPDAAPSSEPESGAIEEEVPPETISIEPPALSPAVLAVQEEGIPLNERYRRACSALGQWADKEENVDVILAGDTEAIVVDPEVLEILRPFQHHPIEILERLMEHLDFMVENRRSYYQALVERGNKEGGKS